MFNLDIVMEKLIADLSADAQWNREHGFAEKADIDRVMAIHPSEYRVYRVG